MSSETAGGPTNRGLLGYYRGLLLSGPTSITMALRAAVPPHMSSRLGGGNAAGTRLPDTIGLDVSLSHLKRSGITLAAAIAQNQHPAAPRPQAGRLTPHRRR